MKAGLCVIAALLLAPGALPAQAAPSAKPEAKSASTSNEVDPAVIVSLRKAFAAQRATGSCRALLQTSIGGNVMPSMEMEVVFPDRIRLKRSGLEIVSVAGKTMVRKGETWTAAPAEVARAIGSLNDAREDEKMLSQATYARSLGQSRIDERLLDGCEVHHKLKGALIKSKIFFSLDDRLIRRVETRAEIQGKSSISTIIIGDYSVPIQIELPK